jgi:hypothetical protein
VLRQVEYGIVTVFLFHIIKGLFSVAVFFVTVEQTIKANGDQFQLLYFYPIFYNFKTNFAYKL